MSCKECGKPKCNCGKDRCSSPAVIQINNPAEVVNFRKVVIPASVGDETTNPPKVGAYSNVILQYEATGTTYIYSSECIPTLISDFSDIAALRKAIEDEEDERKDADQEIWTEIETIEASSDVVDVVGTYAELEAYDTSKLHNNDLIKVLQDETRDDAITYYRWSTSTNTFTYVGAEGPYYTQSQTDTLLDGKQDTLIAGSNIQIAADGKTISATDTTYSDFTGATSQEAGTSGLVPAPATTDVDKYLKGDGTWDTISIPTVTLYSGTGQNTDGAMTQKAVTDSLFANNDVTRIQIGGNGLGASVSNTIAIGSGGSSATKAYDTMVGMGGVTASGGRSTAIGNQGIFASGFASTAIGSSGLQASGEGSVVIGYGGVTASHTQSIALGGTSTTGRNYELSLGRSASGQSSETTRYIAHVTAGVNDTDAVNKKQLDDAIAGVPAANDATLTITQNGVSAGTFTANASSDTTIALTDTTYSAFTGTDGVSAGTAGLVPAPATTDDGKYLKADGTWDAISIPTVTLYSGFGQNTDGAMTQKAVTDGIYSDYANGKIRIGKDGLTSSGTRAIAIGSNGSSATGNYSVMIGVNGVQASGNSSVAIGNSGLYATALGAIAIGYGSSANGMGSIVIGYGGATAEYEQSIALGGYSTTGRTYELSLGKDASGQTPEKTRYIAHVTAGVNDTDAVNKKQLDDAIAGIPAVNNISSGDWSALWQ